MSKLPASAAAQFAAQAVKLLSKGFDDIKQRLDLSDWLDENLDDPDLLNLARGMSGDIGPETKAYFMRTLRSVAGTVELLLEDRYDYAILLLMPLFYSADPCQERLCKVEWDFIHPMARHLEMTCVLPSYSVTFAPHPVSCLTLQQMPPAQMREYLQHLAASGLSVLLPEQSLHFDGEENGLIWAASLRLAAEDYNNLYNRFRKTLRSTKIGEFRHFATQALAEHIGLKNLKGWASVYPPVEAKDAFSSYRVLKLSRRLRLMQSRHLNLTSVLYQFKHSVLTLWLIDAHSIFLEALQMDFFEDSLDQVRSALSYLTSKVGVSITEVEDFSNLPQTASLIPGTSILMPRKL